jgi:hypothetical protein
MVIESLSKTAISGASKWQTDVMLNGFGIHFRQSSCHTMAFSMDTSIL